MTEPADPVVDQLHAAVGDARNLTEQVFTAAGTVSSTQISGGPVKKLVDRWMNLTQNDVWVHCTHLISPAPMGGYLALVGHVWCLRCFPFASPVYEATIRDDECDACHGRATKFTEGLMQIGPFLLCCNVCAECRDAAYIPGVTP